MSGLAHCIRVCLMQAPRSNVGQDTCARRRTQRLRDVILSLHLAPGTRLVHREMVHRLLSVAQACAWHRSRWRPKGLVVRGQRGVFAVPTASLDEARQLRGPRRPGTVHGAAVHRARHRQEGGRIGQDATVKRRRRLRLTARLTSPHSAAFMTCCSHAAATRSRAASSRRGEMIG